MAQIMNFSNLYSMENDDQQFWNDLYHAKQNKAVLEGVVKGVEKFNDSHCWIIILDNHLGGHDVKALIPQSQTNVDVVSDFKAFIGRKVPFVISDLIRDEYLAACSQTAALAIMRDVAFKRFLKLGARLNPEIVTVTKTYLVVEPFGIPTKFYRNDLLLHSYDLRDIYHENDKFLIEVAEMDIKEKTVRFAPVVRDKYASIGSTYKLKSQYAAIVKRPLKGGFMLELEPGLIVFTSPSSQLNYSPRAGDNVVVRLARYVAEDRKVFGDLVPPRRK